MQLAARREHRTGCSALLLERSPPCARSLVLCSESAAHAARGAQARPPVAVLLSCRRSSPHCTCKLPYPDVPTEEAAYLAPFWGLLACCNVSAIIAPGRPLHTISIQRRAIPSTAPEACLVKEFSFKIPSLDFFARAHGVTVTGRKHEELEDTSGKGAGKH